MKSGSIIYTVFIICFTYFVGSTLYYIILALMAFSQSRKRSLELKEKNYSTLASSSFTIPFTVIVPAHNEEHRIADCLKSLLNLDYPEFEIIVVNDGSTDRTMEVLDKILKLRASSKTHPAFLKIGRVHEIYISELHPNVTVISKSGLRKAGALNAGITLARYKYVSVIDADTILEPDALFNLMEHIQKNPEKIIGAGSYFGLLNGFKIKDGKIIKKSFSYNPIVAYQNLEYLRAFIGNRLAWSRFNATPIISGGFGIWRRDILLALGGFDPGFSCEDIEFTFRAHDYIAKNKNNYTVLSLPHYIGWTEGPNSIKSFILQRNRWQRVTHETIWKYRYMLFNPKYKWFGFLTFPYFLFYEVLGVFFEIASIGIVIWAWVIGILGLKTFLAYFALMILSQALISLIVIFVFVRDQSLFTLSYTLYLVVLSFLEFFLYKWITIIAKIMGTFDYLRGDRLFDQYDKRLPKASSR